MGIIFDLDQTIIDSSIAQEARKNRDWKTACGLIHQMKPYKRVVDLIKIMVNQGIEVAVVTSSPEHYCKRVLKYLELMNVITVCYHDTRKHKPNPEPYQLAISKMRNKQKRMIAVGDEQNDIIAAKRAGIESISVGWNHTEMDNEIKPDVF